MYVTGGEAKGIKLLGSKLRIRPSPALIRKAIFNSLGPTIAGASFLDLYAGTGSVGIEALSRGARPVWFVESNPKCCKTIQENLRKTNYLQLARVIKEDVRTLISKDYLGEMRFNIIFLDPPYEVGSAALTLDLISVADILENGGVVIAQHSKREELPLEVLKLHRYKQLCHGDTIISFYAGSR